VPTFKIKYSFRFNWKDLGDAGTPFKHPAGEIWSLSQDSLVSLPSIRDSLTSSFPKI
jgi:hypothetical protein